MKRLAFILIVLALAGCASERYRPVYLSDGSGYSMAERGYSHAPLVYGHNSLYLYGVYPWWTYDFYSPWFYPYRFTYYHPFYDPFYGRYFLAGWSPFWPYYGDYYGRYGWAWAPYRQPPVNPPDQNSFQPGAPVTGPLIGDEYRRRSMDQRGYTHDRAYQRAAMQQPGAQKHAPGVVMPASKAAPYAPHAKARQSPGGFATPDRAMPGLPTTRASTMSRPAFPSIGSPATSTPRFEQGPAVRPHTHRDR